MRGSEDYTKIITIDEKEFNANYIYEVIACNQESPVPEVLTTIRFQKGPIKENGVNGIHHEDLIAIVIDRLESFQESEYSCRENVIAITKLDEALHSLRRRTNERKDRGVEGTSEI
jgi:hypothetical protein